jgi:hypothetical protein
LLPLCFSYASENKKYLWGDKDTYSLAFAAAGKAHLYFQVEIPPGAVTNVNYGTTLHDDFSAALKHHTAIMVIVLELFI